MSVVPSKKMGMSVFHWAGNISKAWTLEQGKEYPFPVNLFSSDPGCLPRKHAGQEEEVSSAMWSDFHIKEVGVFLCPDQWEVWRPQQCLKVPNMTEIKMGRNPNI